MKILFSLACLKQYLKPFLKFCRILFFSNETNWKLVNFIFKHSNSARRFTPGFSGDFNKVTFCKLKPGMAQGDLFELQKIIVSDSNRNHLIIKRNEIENAFNFDFTL